MPAELATTLTATDDQRLLQAEAVVRAYCGWHIAPERTDTTVVPWGTTATRVTLPTLRLVSVDAVRVDGVALDPAMTFPVSGTPDGVLTVHSSQMWAWSMDPLDLHGLRTTWTTAEVDYTHGYAQPPAEVTAVVQAMASRAVVNPDSMTRVQKGPFADFHSQAGQNQSPAMGLLDAEKDLLAPYRLPARA